MSKLNIRYYRHLASAATGERMPVGLEDGYAAGEEVDFTTVTRGEAVGMPDSTRMVRLNPTADCRVAITKEARDPIAGDILMRAGSAEYFGVLPGMVITVLEVTL